MKKLIIMLILTMLFITGCQASQMSGENIYDAEKTIVEQNMSEYQESDEEQEVPEDRELTEVQETIETEDPIDANEVTGDEDEVPSNSDDNISIDGNYEQLIYDEKEYAEDYAHSDLDPNPEGRMAHNIYSDPDLSQTSGRYKGFLIDFKTDHMGQSTYWALCNFDMDKTELEERLGYVSGGGAYCGLQKRHDGTKAIMSFWEVETDQGNITPSLVYPSANGEGLFNNEGSGANYIPDYEWSADTWYRMYICSYTDIMTENTFVDMYVMEIESGIWDKICTYDTKLKNSCFVGGMSQFMENYDAADAQDPRSFQYANICVRENDTNEWKAITKAMLSVDTWWDNKKGYFDFGATNTDLWGVSVGYGQDQAVLNSDISDKYIIAPVGTSWEYLP